MKRAIQNWFIFYTALLISPLSLADAYSDPFQVSIFSSDILSNRMHVSANGDTMISWYQGEGAARTTYMQRYDSLGRVLQAQPWNLGKYANNMALSPSGSFSLLTSKFDGDGNGVFLTTYDRNGGLLINERLVNNSRIGNQKPSAIEINDNNHMVIAWVKEGPGFEKSLYLKSYPANGAASTEILIHTMTQEYDYFGAVDIGIDNLGNFVIAWDAGNFHTTNWKEVYSQRFDVNGNALSGITQVNSYMIGGQDQTKIAMNGNGDYVIVWESNTPEDTTRDAVYSQRYNAAGIAQGGITRISNTESGIDGFNIDMDQNGGFVLTWIGKKDPTINYSSRETLLRGFDRNGIPNSDVMVVSNSTNIHPIIPAVGINKDGNFMISWMQTSFISNQPSYIYARRYSPSGTSIQPLVNGQTKTGLNGGTASWQYFKVTVPVGHTTLDTAIFGGTGDADVYVRYANLPTLNTWDARPYRAGNNETARITGIPAGEWYIGIYGFSAYSGLSLQSSSF